MVELTKNIFLAAPKLLGQTIMIKKSHIRLSRLIIENYKKLDFLDMKLPAPIMQGDSDILIFGSKNGGGKTSILECCALLILAGIGGKNFNNNHFVRENELIFDILIKAGQKSASIVGYFEQDEKKCTVSIVIDKNGFKTTLSEDKSIFEPFFDKRKWYGLDYFLNSILAISGEPLIFLPLLHFNSYRKIQESNPELGMMADDYPMDRIMLQASSRIGMRRNIGNPISSFKLEILRSLMGKASLFEGLDKNESKSVLEQLNGLIKRYCGGEIEHLRPLPDNKVDIRIKPSDGSNSFSFDGLSSGQKEMIATLFLIWKNTQNQPSIVLIDEPELHLNTEWHVDFVRQLYKLAPNNQYVLATHSEEMFRSVNEYQRAILVPNHYGETL